MGGGGRSNDFALLFYILFLDVTMNSVVLRPIAMVHIYDFILVRNRRGLSLLHIYKHFASYFRFSVLMVIWLSCVCGAGAAGGGVSASV